MSLGHVAYRPDFRICTKSLSVLVCVQWIQSQGTARVKTFKRVLNVPVSLTGTSFQIDLVCKHTLNLVFTGGCSWLPLLSIYPSLSVLIGSSPAGISQKTKDREGLPFAVTGTGVEKDLEMEPTIQGSATES